MKSEEASKGEEEKEVGRVRCVEERGQSDESANEYRPEWSQGQHGPAAPDPPADRHWIPISGWQMSAAACAGAVSDRRPLPSPNAPAALEYFDD